MSEKLIFVDVDDTLYSKNQRCVPLSAAQALHQAQKNGHKVFINTGRPFVYFEKEILDLGLDGLLCCNGIHLVIDGQTVYHQTVPKPVMHQIMKSCEQHGIYGTLEGAKASYFRNHDVNFHPHYGFMIQAFDLAPYMPHEFSWDHAEECDKLIVFAGAGSDMKGFIKDLDSMADIMDYVRIDDTQYEILLKDHDKGTALLFVADYMKKTPEDCYAFGDSNNDISMFQKAGHSIAMGNACDELKECADYITEHIDNDGLYLGLKHYGLI